MTPPVPVAVLDANVLVPAGLRDLLLSLASEGAFRPVWQDEILDELTRSSVRIRMARGMDSLTARTGATHVRNQMAKAFPDASLNRAGWEPLVTGMTNHEKDRHVLAAAVAVGATHLVTSNLKDFPIDSVPGSIGVVTPNMFTCMLLDRSPDMVIGALERMSVRLRNPPVSTYELAAAMSEGTQLAEFGQRLVRLLSP